MATRHFQRRTAAYLALLVASASLLSCERKPQPKPPRVAKCTHALGLCNLCMFIAKEQQTALPFGVKIDLVNIPNWGDHATALESGKVDFSVTPLTNVITAYANGSPIKIVSGSGVNGLYLLTSRDITDADSLRGKRVGTFRADTLEMFLYSYLKQHGLSYNDIEVVYFTDGFEIITAFQTHRIDAMTHVEPYASQAVREFGANKLADGKTVWKTDHPDCVLVASDRIIKQDPSMVVGLIRGMLEAEATIKENPDSAVRRVVGTYYKSSFEDIQQAARSQPPGVDIRDKADWTLARFSDLQDLNYIKSAADDKIMDFRFLEQALAERGTDHGNASPQPTSTPSTQ